jgi:hypothetical protein
MTDTTKRQCGCSSGKSCFLSYELAQNEIKRFRDKRSSIKMTGRYLSVYRCKICDCWHVGNTRRQQDKRR